MEDCEWVPAAQEALVTRQELAAILRVHPATLRRWERLGIVPRLRIGGRVRYRASDVFAAIREVQAHEQPGSAQ